MPLCFLDKDPPGDGDIRQTMSGKWAVHPRRLYRWLGEFDSEEDAAFIRDIIDDAVDNVIEDYRIASNRAC